MREALWQHQLARITKMQLQCFSLSTCLDVRRFKYSTHTCSSHSFYQKQKNLWLKLQSLKYFQHRPHIILSLRANNFMLFFSNERKWLDVKEDITRMLSFKVNMSISDKIFPSNTQANIWLHKTRLHRDNFLSASTRYNCNDLCKGEQ